MLLHTLEKQKLIHPPKWLADNCSFLTIFGSNAYAVSTDESDVDYYGFAMPPRNVVFPHEAGVIHNFGHQGEQFNQWQQHGIKSLDGTKVYDFTVFSIVRYFQLLMEGNPNIVDSIFVPRRCIVHSTAVGEHLRENRKLFLSLAVVPKLKGYAYSELAKVRAKKLSDNEKRNESIQRWGYDCKRAYHIVRLASEAEQILIEGDLDLERNREQLKSIRRGEWSFEDLEKWFTEKERHLEALQVSSKLPAVADEDAIKNLLLTCLEMHFGNLEKAVVRQTNGDKLVSEIEAVLAKYK